MAATLLVLLPAAEAQVSRAAARKAARQYNQVRKNGLNPTTVDVLADLARYDHPLAVDPLVRTFQVRDYALWAPARKILAGYRDEDTLDRIEEFGLGHGDGVVRGQVLEAVALGRPAGLDWKAWVATGLDDDAPEMRAAAVRAAGRLRLTELVNPILTLSADPREIVRQEVPGALVRLVGSRCLAVLDELATDPRWRVRLAATAGYADLKTPEAVERLVEVLDREPGRVKEDALFALQRLTARVYGPDAATWRAFLETAPDDFLAQADRVALAPPRYAGGISYHDIGTASRRFVFVTDLSGSMSSAALTLDRYGTPSTRLAIAGAELQRLIAGLDPSYAFNLVTFSGKAKVWRRALIPANDQNRLAARQRVRDYRPDGGTNVYGGLTAALDMAERSLDASARAPFEDVDTVFLLTDGAPTAGAIIHPDLLADHVAERNRTLKLRVHCVSLTTQDVNQRFLQRLADESLGQAVERVRER